MAAIGRRYSHLHQSTQSTLYLVQPRFLSSSDSELQTQPPLSSKFDDVKVNLHSERRKDRLQIPYKPLLFPNSNLESTPPSTLEQIRRKLVEFRPRSTPSGKFVSFQELYKRNVLSNSDSDFTPNHSFESLRDNIRRLRNRTAANKTMGGSGGKIIDPMSLTGLKETLKRKPLENIGDSPSIISIGDTSSSMTPAQNVGSSSSRVKVVKLYDYEELGKKLELLRPEKKGKRFCLQELSMRLSKLREIEVNNLDVEATGDLTFTDLSNILLNAKLSDDEKEINKTAQRLDVLSQLGRTPSFMLSPPKEHLVEKYFHPDNMSSAEKLKLELKKVREEFKMSEADCGSTRVQVAELTTKIKYLSTVLLKKDKHSLKGLQAMVQKRKKMLKYLRRTDWDSYSMVISKLGLRDNPDMRKV